MSEYKPPNDKELVEWKALCEAATPGPWKADVYYVVGQVKGGRPGGEVIIECRSSNVKYEANARHVAAARTALPRCIEEVKRLRAEVTQMSTWDRLRAEPDALEVIKKILQGEMWRSRRCGELYRLIERPEVELRKYHADPF